MWVGAQPNPLPRVPKCCPNLARLSPHPPTHPPTPPADELLDEAVCAAVVQRLVKPNDFVVCLKSVRGNMMVKVVQVR